MKTETLYFVIRRERGAWKSDGPYDSRYVANEVRDLTLGSQSNAGEDVYVRSVKVPVKP